MPSSVAKPWGIVRGVNPNPGANTALIAILCCCIMQNVFFGHRLSEITSGHCCLCLDARGLFTVGGLLRK